MRGELGATSAVLAVASASSAADSFGLRRRRRRRLPVSPPGVASRESSPIVEVPGKSRVSTVKPQIEQTIAQAQAHTHTHPCRAVPRGTKSHSHQSTGSAVHATTATPRAPSCSETAQMSELSNIIIHAKIPSFLCLTHSLTHSGTQARTHAHTQTHPTKKRKETLQVRASWPHPEEHGELYCFNDADGRNYLTRVSSCFTDELAPAHTAPHALVAVLAPSTTKAPASRRHPHAYKKTHFLSATRTHRAHHEA